MTHETMPLRRWVKKTLDACSPGDSGTVLESLSLEDTVLNYNPATWRVYINAKPDATYLLRLRVSDDDGVYVSHESGVVSPEGGRLYGRAMLDVAEVAKALEVGYAKYCAEVEERNTSELREELARECAELIARYHEGRVRAGKYWIEFEAGKITSVEETEED